MKKLKKKRSRFFRFLLAVLFILFLFFDPDFIVRRGYVAGLGINYLDLRFRVRGFLVLLFALSKIKESLVIPRGVLFLIILLGMLHSNLSAIWALYKFLNVVFIFVAVTYLVQFVVMATKKQLIMLKHIILALGVLELVLALLQIFFGGWYRSLFIHSFFVKLGEPRTFEAVFICCGNYVPRAYGTFPHPNVLAFVSLVFFSLYLYVEGRLGLPAFVFMVLVLLSLSKTGILVLVLILLIYSFKRAFLQKKLFNWYLMFGLVFVLISPFIVWLWGSLGLDSYYFFKMRNLAFNYFVHIVNISKLIFGIGFLNYFVELVEHVKLLVYNGTLFIEPIHNALWLFGIEFGIAAIFIFLYLWVKFWRQTWQKAQDYNARQLILSIFLVFVLFMAFDHFLYY